MHDGSSRSCRRSRKISARSVRGSQLVGVSEFSEGATCARGAAARCEFRCSGRRADYRLAARCRHRYSGAARFDRAAAANGDCRPFSCRTIRTRDIFTDIRQLGAISGRSRQASTVDRRAAETHARLAASVSISRPAARVRRAASAADLDGRAAIVHLQRCCNSPVRATR